MRFALHLFFWLALVGVGVIELAAWAGRHRADLPWIPLDLSRPAGARTASRLAALDDRPWLCQALLRSAGARITSAPSRIDGPRCGYDGALRLIASGPAAIGFLPSAPVTSCPLAAGLWLWQRDVVEPAAERFLGARVIAIEQAGSYNCRRIDNQAAGAWSEHASANALDVTGFRLSRGGSVRMARDWDGNSARSRFLHAVRDGACGQFTTVLSPDYNAAHRDHLHLDMADRAGVGWTACR
jgi:hypothetical protein